VKNAGEGACFATPATKFKLGTPKVCALMTNSGWLGYEAFALTAGERGQEEER
jgi:hypothetical protein